MIIETGEAWRKADRQVAKSLFKICVTGCITLCLQSFVYTASEQHQMKETGNRAEKKAEIGDFLSEERERKNKKR